MANNSVRALHMMCTAPAVIHAGVRARSDVAQDLKANTGSRKLSTDESSPPTPMSQSSSSSSSSPSSREVRHFVDNADKERILQYALGEWTYEKSLSLLTAVLQSHNHAPEAKSDVVAYLLPHILATASATQPSSVESVSRDVAVLLWSAQLYQFVEKYETDLGEQLTSVCVSGLLQSDDPLLWRPACKWLVRVQWMSAGNCATLAQYLERVLAGQPSNLQQMSARDCFSALHMTNLGVRVSTECTRLFYRRLADVLPSTSPPGNALEFMLTCSAARAVAALRLNDPSLLAALSTYHLQCVRAGNVHSLAAFCSLLYPYSQYWHSASQLFAEAHDALVHHTRALAHEAASPMSLVHLVWAFLAQGAKPPPVAVAQLVAKLEPWVASKKIDLSLLLELEQVLMIVPDSVAWKSQLRTLISELSPLIYQPPGHLQSPYTRVITALCAHVATTHPPVRTHVYTPVGHVAIAALVSTQTNAALLDWPEDCDVACLEKATAVGLPGRPVAVVMTMWLSFREVDTEFVLGPFWRRVLMLEECGWTVVLLPMRMSDLGQTAAERADAVMRLIYTAGS